MRLVSLLVEIKLVAGLLLEDIKHLLEHVLDIHADIGDLVLVVREILLGRGLEQEVLVHLGGDIELGVLEAAVARTEHVRAHAFPTIDSTRVCSITANLGDVKTTITHPASTSHGRLSEAQRQAAGIGQGLVRVSVGLEHLDDLKADLLRGLDTLP